MTSAQQTELFDWPTYLAKTGAEAAPPEAFCQNQIIPENPFRLGQKVEIDSPDIEGRVHLGSVVYLHGPRISVRFDGCDALNDVFLCVDSGELSSVGSRRHLWAPPLRYSKDISKYFANCDRLLKNLPAEMIASPEVFLKPPKASKKNLFQVGQKLEAVDLKQPYSICVATIKKVDLNNVEIHLDGWEKSSDYICSFNSRNLFPVGWCEKAGYRLVAPGPKAEYSNNVSLKVLPSQDSRAKLISPVNNVPPLTVAVSKSKAPPEPSMKSPAKAAISPKAKPEVIVTAKKSPPSKSTIVKPLQNGTCTKVIASKSSPPGPALQSTVQSSLIVPILKISTAIQTVKRTKPSTKSLSGSKRKLNQEFDKTQHNNSKNVKTPLISQNPINTIPNNTDKTNAATNAAVNAKVNNDHSTKIVNNKLQQHNSAASMQSVSAVSIEEWDHYEVINFLLKNDQLKGLGLTQNLTQHKIDGKALLILSVKTMTSEMGISLGRALKFRHFIDKIISNSK